MTEDLTYIWQEVQRALRDAVGTSAYEIWLAPVQPRSLDGRHLDVAAPEELRAWITDRFGAVLDRVASRVLQRSVTVRVGRLSGNDTGSGPDGRFEVPRSARDAVEPEVPTDVPLNPKFSFDQFVIGDASRFAHASALAVAELPGQAYNPLFIYGPPGVGKTHLLHAVGNYVRAYGGGLTVRYTTSERFTNDFVSSVKAGGPTMERFKDRYRRPDVLLIDDVQFLQSKARTQEEFFHTFNALLEAGSQLVMTADRLPGDFQAFQERLQARFASGLVTEIEPPDRSARLTILRKRAAHDGIHLEDPGVLALVADRVTASVRALEAALIRIVAFASLTGREIDRDLAEHVLRDLYPRETAPGIGQERPATTVPAIQTLVCEAFAVTEDELVSTDRSARVAWPRQVAMYLARRHTDTTLPAIGRQFGGRSHTTVMHAVKTTTRRLEVDEEAREVVHRLHARLGSAAPDRQD